jgi:ribonuclease VapC
LGAQKVLDSCAVIHYLEQEPGCEAVVDILAAASAQEKPLLMCAVNWGEVYYTSLERYGEERAAEVERVIKTFPIQVVDVDTDIAREAARFKAGHKLSYADCFAAALAKLRKAELVTGDPEFRQVEGEIKIRWL